MSKDDVVIEVKNVSKTFKLPTNKAGSVKSIFTNVFKLSKFKNYETQKALSDVSFSVNKGEFFGIVGRNGSGKSTLLKMLAGIYVPSKGSIKTTGKIVPFIELGVGFNPELSGRDNVYLNGALLGFTDKEVDEKYNQIVEFAELERFMGQKLKNYSSGMQVRLAFSVATILADSDILLLDEVLAVGDADFQRKCFDYFKTLKKQKKTVVFVSHDMNAVREYCDRAILIDKGNVIAKGSSTSVSNEYTKLFLSGSKDENRKDGNHVGNGKALISGFKSSMKVKEKSETIKISFKADIKNDIDEIAAGFKLKSSDDRHLFGTNNIKNKRIKNVKSGEKISIDFSFDNILNSGDYMVDLALESPSGEVYDWMIDALKIEVLTEKSTGYIIDPPVKIEVTHDKPK